MVSKGPLVLDTSIATAWFFIDEPFHNKTVEVMKAVGGDPRSFLVPPLFYSEFVHVLTRKSGRDFEFVKNALNLIIRMGLRAISLSDTALDYMAKWTCAGMSGYDATFVALAEDIKGRWLTADKAGARIVKGTGAASLVLQLSAWS